ncbi:hypothetical protein NQZ68_033483 [Dissostichus eleginoides]|uniref:Callose synthase 12 n=1 Tax=Dissostichus eleginoides TaxID=100907 RepID=A0AAD9CE70_DISEL|nr:hypothetical protein NQZ68_033483 [Dissostichus eleginoides]KAK1899576.1 Callose synthase 12 [Dissostichus eleginoides]
MRRGLGGRYHAVFSSRVKYVLLFICGSLLQCSSCDKQKPAGSNQRRGQIICGAGERVDSPSLWLWYGETSRNSRQEAAQLQPSDSIRKLLCCLSTS